MISVDARATRFVATTPKQATFVLVAVLLVCAFFQWVAWTQSTFPVYNKPKEETDVEVYRRVISRVRAGGTYYDTLHAEFVNLNYPLHSIFNYRTPTYAKFFALFPQDSWGQVIGIALAGATLVLCYIVFWQSSARAAGVCAVAFAGGALAWCFVDSMYLFTEVWAGTLITLSVAAYALGLRWLGVLAGLLALFFRELAFPYCAVAFFLAVWEARKREVFAWLAGLALYGLFFALHAREVVSRLPPSVDGASVANWIQFSGPSFLLATMRTDLWLLLSPSWVVALCLPLGVLGLASWRHQLCSRAMLTALVYLTLFMVVGGMKNFYWGLLYSPLLALGLPLAPRALRDLIEAIRGSPGANGARL